MSKWTNMRQWISCSARAALAPAVAISIHAFAQSPVDQAAAMQESGTKQVAELPLVLPAPPKDANLLSFDPARKTSMKFYIDRASVVFGADGILRYTVVAEGDRGVRNLSYEGIQCETRSSKVYAYGREDGGWSQVREPAWVRIEATDAYRYALYRDYFCPVKSNVQSAAEAIDALKRGINPRIVDFGATQPAPR